MDTHVMDVGLCDLNQCIKSLVYVRLVIILCWSVQPGKQQQLWINLQVIIMRWDRLLNVSCNDISVIYVTAHTADVQADWRSWTYGRLGPHATP